MRLIQFFSVITDFYLIKLVITPQYQTNVKQRGLTYRCNIPTLYPILDWHLTQ